MIHLSGRVGYVYLDGGVESYPAGTQGIMYEARPGYMRNDAQVSTSTVWTRVANPGKPLSSAVAAAAAPAPGAPNTGNSAAADGRGIPLVASEAAFLLLVLAASSVLAVWWARAPRPRD